MRLFGGDQTDAIQTKTFVFVGLDIDRKLFVKQIPGRGAI